MAIVMNGAVVSDCEISISHVEQSREGFSVIGIEISGDGAVYNTGEIMISDGDFNLIRRGIRLMEIQKKAMEENGQ